MAIIALALVVVATLSTGNPGQVTVARLAERIAPSRALLTAAIVAAGTSAGMMAWAGAILAGTVSAVDPGAGMAIAAAALVLAAAQLARRVHVPPIAEPTRSFAAIVLALFAKQALDGARLAGFAIGAASGEPLLAGAGAVLGGAAGAALGWLSGSQPPGALRCSMAVGCVLAALATGWAGWSA